MLKMLDPRLLRFEIHSSARVARPDVIDFLGEVLGDLIELSAL